MVDLCSKRQFKHCWKEMPSRKENWRSACLPWRPCGGRSWTTCRCWKAASSPPAPAFSLAPSRGRRDTELARPDIYLPIRSFLPVPISSSVPPLAARSLACSMDHENFSLLRRQKAQGTSRISPSVVTTASHRSSRARIPVPARCNRGGTRGWKAIPRSSMGSSARRGFQRRHWLSRKFHGVGVLAGRSQPPDASRSHGGQPVVVAAPVTARPEAPSKGAEPRYVDRPRPFRSARHTDLRAMESTVPQVSDISWYYPIAIAWGDRARARWLRGSVAARRPRDKIGARNISIVRMLRCPFWIYRRRGTKPIGQRTTARQPDISRLMRTEA
jgi:hypothetical protein